MLAVTLKIFVPATASTSPSNTMQADIRNQKRPNQKRPRQSAVMEESVGLEGLDTPEPIPQTYTSKARFSEKHQDVLIDKKKTLKESAMIIISNPQRKYHSNR